MAGRVGATTRAFLCRSTRRTGHLYRHVTPTSTSHLPAILELGAGVGARAAQTGRTSVSRVAFEIGRQLRRNVRLDEVD
jgi:hypothetical protein